MTSEKTVVVVGAGLGGLALAIRLQSAGIQTTIVEARDKPGGRAYFWERDGFTFDAGPTVITDPAALRELWALSGRDMADDVTLLAVDPHYRLNWPDGVQFDCVADDEQLRRQIAKLDPRDLAGYQNFLAYAAGIYAETYEKRGVPGYGPKASALQMIQSLARYQPWRSVYSTVSRFIQNEKLREALSFQTMMVGGNPMKASSIYTLGHILERRGGFWAARGGTNRLVAGMAALFERLGGTLLLGDPVEEIETAGDRAIAVRTRSGVRILPQAIASNADAMHSYGLLLGASPRGRQMAERLAHKRYSPSFFLVHFGITGSWPGIPHHMMLFGQRFAGFFADIFDHGVLPQDLAIYLHHPTVTDPSLAPMGHSTFYALVPVPHLGKFPVDWAHVGPILERRVLDEIGRRLIPDIHSRILTKFHYAPPDFARDLGAYHGTGSSLEPAWNQMGPFRVHNRDEAIHNLYFVGDAVHPGAGIPGVLKGAKATAMQMIEGLR